MKSLSVLVTIAYLLSSTVAQAVGGNRNNLRRRAAIIESPVDCPMYPTYFYLQNLIDFNYELLIARGRTLTPFYSAKGTRLGNYTSASLLQPDGTSVGTGNLQLTGADLPGPPGATSILFGFGDALSLYAPITGGTLTASGVSGFLGGFIELNPNLYVLVVIICGSDFEEYIGKLFESDPIYYNTSLTTLTGDPDFAFDAGESSSYGTIGEMLASVDSSSSLALPW